MLDYILPLILLVGKIPTRNLITMDLYGFYQEKQEEWKDISQRS
jgi:hypothetical protein